MDIYKYATYPTTEEVDGIYCQKKEAFKNMELQIGGKKTYGILQGKEMEYDFWLIEYNNRILDLINAYVLTSFYYNKGIPDERWTSSPRPGFNVNFPDFKEEHHSYAYWFDFYLESYYTKFFGIIDTLYHLVNLKYELFIEPKPRFNAIVLKKLSEIEEELASKLLKENLKKDSAFETADQYRNDLTHNYRPHQISSPMKRRKASNEDYIYDMKTGARTLASEVRGVEIYDFSSSSYTTTKEFMKNINDSIDFLGKLILEIKDKLE